MKVDENKFFGYQIIAVSIIWIGMSIFFKKMNDSGVIIYYVVTSWLLFLLVIYFKNKYKQRKVKSKMVTLENKKEEEKRDSIITFLFINFVYSINKVVCGNATRICNVKRYVLSQLEYLINPNILIFLIKLKHIQLI